ncbi:Glycoside hydrolase family 24 protein [Mycena venus]|uniref:Glycoside hydrolase family 24 protein n=1 Tax=Mycena venus TaxID=2733690 RepID=A0A8H7CEX2_9AGAR|nr:Glycoside hydrolase family 24 protein [Mycena venus]
MLAFFPIPLVLLLVNLVHGAPVAVSDRRCIGGAEACSRSIDCYATGLCGPALAKKSTLVPHVFRSLKYARQDDDSFDSFSGDDTDDSGSDDSDADVGADDSGTDDSTESDFDDSSLDTSDQDASDDNGDSSDGGFGDDQDVDTTADQGDDQTDSQADDGSDSTDLDGDDGTQADDTSDQSADGSDQGDDQDTGDVTSADGGDLSDDSGDSSDGLDDGQDDGNEANDDGTGVDSDGDSSTDPDATSTAADAGITDAPGSDSTTDGEDQGDQSTTDGGDDSQSTTSDSAAAADSTSTATDPTSTDDASNSSDSAAAATSTSAADQPAASDSSSDSLTCGGGPSPNAATISLIKQFEGFVPSPAPDPIGLPTVGFGHKCTSKGCAEVTNAGFSFPLSQNTASQLLNNDVQQFVSCVNSAVSNSVTLTDNQVGALTAFAFNLGCGTLKSSTLLKRLNNGEDPNTVAAAEIPRFNKAGGKVLAGLTRRRAAEVALFQTPSQVKAHPC